MKMRKTVRVGFFGRDVPTRHRARSAFSLVEIVLTLGIVSFALVGVMGLFPVAMSSAQESQHETRAAHIAQLIFTDLSTGSGTHRILFSGTNLSIDRIRVNLSTMGSNTLYYDVEGRAMGNIAAVDAIYGATVTVTPDTLISGLTQVETTVFTPTAPAQTNRSRFTFVTLMNTQ